MSWFRTTKTKTVHKYQKNMEVRKIEESKEIKAKDNTQKQSTLPMKTRH